MFLPDQRGEQGNIAELSPGAVGAGAAAGGAGGLGGGGARAGHQAAMNSMMMERMSTDICALKKQYVRIKRRQQQQAMQLYIRTGGADVLHKRSVLVRGRSFTISRTQGAFLLLDLSFNIRDHKRCGRFNMVTPLLFFLSTLKLVINTVIGGLL